MMGKQKAAVLPDPVCAHAIMSRPPRPMGIAYFCTGVGFVYLQRRMLPISASPRSRSSKVSMCAGTSRPLVSTGMSSYASKLMPVFSAPKIASDSDLMRASASKGSPSTLGGGRGEGG